MMETYTLNSVPASKKNSKRMIWVGGKPRLICSEVYMRWEKIAKHEIQKQVNGEPIVNCKRMLIEFYVKDKRRRDLDNLCAGIFDVMKDVGIIEDDNYFVIPEVTLRYIKSEADKTIITIT